MKKIIFILMMTLCLTFTSCHNNENRHNEITNLRYTVDKVEVDNHDYIIARTIGGMGDGISIIHSESCKCKNGK